MAYYPTDADFRAIRQKEKNVYVKIELLNKNFKIIDSLTANLVNDSLSVDPIIVIFLLLIILF